jgi:hypothetical protein
VSIDMAIITHRVHCPLYGCDVATEYEAEMDHHVLQPHSKDNAERDRIRRGEPVRYSLCAAWDLAIVEDGQRTAARTAERTWRGEITPERVERDHATAARWDRTLDAMLRDGMDLTLPHG